MASLTLLVIGGWFLTQYFGDIATREKREDYEQVVEVLSQTMRIEVSELERFVALISEWPTTLPALASGTPKAIDASQFRARLFLSKAPGIRLLFNEPPRSDHCFLQPPPP